MSAQASIVINDGQTSPVAHTFIPKGARTLPEGVGVAEWRDVTTGVNAEVNPTIVERHTPPNGNRLEKFQWTIDLPTAETVGTNDAGITPPVRKAYSTQVQIVAWVPTRASAQELKDIAAFAKNFAALAMFKDAIEKREAAW